MRGPQGLLPPEIPTAEMGFTTTPTSDRRDLRWCCRRRAADVVGRDRFLVVHLDAPLEVCRARDTSGRYADQQEIGTIVLNTGDYMQRISNDILPSTTHRVSQPRAAELARAAGRPERTSLIGSANPAPRSLNAGLARPCQELEPPAFH